MFTVDLLKGQGLPAKSSPKCIALAVGTFAVPAVAGLFLLGLYLSNSVLTSTQKRSLSRYDGRIDRISAAVEAHRSLQESKRTLSGFLDELPVTVQRFTQWSPILVTVVEEMPRQVALTELKIHKQSVKAKVPSRDDPAKSTDITVPARTMQLCVAQAAGSGTEEVVKGYMDRLRASESLGPSIADMRVSQELVEIAGTQVPAYQILCVLDSGF
jgi:hypothetical protein